MKIEGRWERGGKLKKIRMKKKESEKERYRKEINRRKWGKSKGRKG